MQISFGTKTLSDSTRQHAASAIRMATQGNVQIAPRVRSRNAEAFIRQNYRTDVSFTVTDLHASLDAAEQFVLEQAEELKDLGSQDLIMRTSANQSQRTLKYARLSGIQIAYTGLSTVTNYSFSGEQIV